MNQVIKHIILIIATFALSVSNASPLQFVDLSLGDAIKLSKEENKKVIIDFYTDWCAPCKVLSNTVFTNDELGDYYNSRFISIRINGESKEGIQLVKQYNVKAYPSMLFLNENGQELLKVVGVREPQELIQLGKQIESTQSNDLSLLHERYNNGERSRSFMIEYLNELQDNGFQTELIASAYIINHGVDIYNEMDLSILSMTNIDYDSKAAQSVFENLPELKQKFPALIKIIVQNAVMNKFEEAYNQKNRDLLNKDFPQMIKVYQLAVDNSVTNNNLLEVLSSYHRIEIKLAQV